MCFFFHTHSIQVRAFWCRKINEMFDVQFHNSNKQIKKNQQEKKKKKQTSQQPNEIKIHVLFINRFGL